MRAGVPGTARQPDLRPVEGHPRCATLDALGCGSIHGSDPGANGSARRPMDFNVLRGRLRRSESHASGAVPGPESMPVGDDDRGGWVAGCPTCGRPIGFTTLRCPGCGTRLIGGVRLRGALLFSVTGIAAGLLVGLAAAAAMYFPSSRQGPSSAGPTASPGPTIAASAGPATPGASSVPAQAAAALRLALTVADRLATSGTALHLLVNPGRPDAAVVAAALRGIAADGAYASEVVGRLDGWAEADPLRTQLETYFERIRTTARAGLAVSIGNSLAYRTSGRRMVVVLSSLPALRAAIVEFAAAHGVDVPAAP
jgi:hypothetical protein